jgi:hypothetical protein
MVAKGTLMAPFAVFSSNCSGILTSTKVVSLSLIISRSDMLIGFSGEIAVLQEIIEKQIKHK